MWVISSVARNYSVVNASALGLLSPGKMRKLGRSIPKLDPNGRRHQIDRDLNPVPFRDGTRSLHDTGLARHDEVDYSVFAGQVGQGLERIERAAAGSQARVRKRLI